MPEVKDANRTIAARKPDNQSERYGLRLLNAMLLVALGGWLLARALQTFRPDDRLEALPAFMSGGAAGWATGALILGCGVLFAAMALPNGRVWAWVGASAVALATLILLIAAWFLDAGGDWIGVLLAFAAVVVLAAPTVRELYLH